MRSDSVLKKLINKPHTLFLIDGVGALLTAIFIGIVFTRFESSFGMPKTIAYILAAIAGMFCIYSLTCYYVKPRRWQPLLKVIALANLLYCSLTVLLAAYFYQQLTLLALIYFLAEIIVVMWLVKIEFAAVKSATW